MMTPKVTTKTYSATDDSIREKNDKPLTRNQTFDSVCKMLGLNPADAVKKRKELSAEDRTLEAVARLHNLTLEQAHELLKRRK